MKKATITQTKNQLSQLLEAVRHGETVIIMDRNIPVARLEPVFAGSSADPEGQLAGLERKGIIRRAKAAVPASFFDDDPPKAKKGSSVLRALLDERNEGR